MNVRGAGTGRTGCPRHQPFARSELARSRCPAQACRGFYRYCPDPAAAPPRLNKPHRRAGSLAIGAVGVPLSRNAARWAAEMSSVSRGLPSPSAMMHSPAPAAIGGGSAVCQLALQQPGDGGARLGCRCDVIEPG